MSLDTLKTANYALQMKSPKTTLLFKTVLNVNHVNKVRIKIWLRWDGSWQGKNGIEINNKKIKWEIEINIVPNITTLSNKITKK